MSSFPTGSQWNKWVLHVHTPLSMEQQHGVGGGDAWEKFISGIESLPPEFKVIGINDDFYNKGKL